MSTLTRNEVEGWPALRSMAGIAERVLAFIDEHDDMAAELALTRAALANLEAERGAWEVAGNMADEEHKAERLAAQHALAAAQAQRDVLAQEAVTLRAALVEAKGAIDLDRTGLAAALSDIKKHVGGYAWLLEGRGSYEWNDDRYRDEAGYAMRPTVEIAERALQASGSLAQAAWSKTQAALSAPSTAAATLAIRDAAQREVGYKRFEAQLAAAQADNARLRAALQACRTSNAADFTWWRPYRDIVDAAIAAPAGDDALREFGLRVAVAVHENDGDGTLGGTLPEVVDAVLRGDDR
jgi:hypothetical protein